MRRIVGLALLGLLPALHSPVRAGEPPGPKLIHKDGILRVFEDVRHYGKGKGVPYYYLMELDTHFGLQYRRDKKAEGEDGPNKDLSRMPTCYHHEQSPIGIVMGTLNAKKSPPPFAVVGMHIGAMAAYAQPSQDVHFFENNPKVIALSQTPKGDPYFTYLQDAGKRGAKIQVFQGKERALLAEKAPKKHYQVIVVEMCLRARLEDVCVELMTKEGMSLLLDKLTDTGFACYHVSNRYLKMTPVLTDVARDLGLAVRHGHDQAPDSRVWDDTAHFQSEWVMVARKKEILDRLQPPPHYEELMKDEGHKEPYWDEPQPTGKHVWSDKSPHPLKGLMRSDPITARLVADVDSLAWVGINTFENDLDRKTVKGLIALRNWMYGALSQIPPAVGRLRADRGLTIEDLQ